DGTFVLPFNRASPHYEHVLAVADGGERQGIYEFGPEVLDATTRTPIKIVLKPSRRVSVRVVDGSGKPVAEATVGATGYFVEAPIHVGKTDENGAVSLLVPADLKVEWVIGFKAGVGFDYFENYPFWPPTAESKPRLLPEQIKLVLDGARQMHIRAVNSDGRPLPEVGFVPWTIKKPGKMADVNLSGSRLAAQSTDAQGIASFDWLPVNVTQDVAFLCQDGEDLHLPDSPRFRPGGSETELTARLLRNARVAGKVLLPNGTPARDILIQAEGRGATNHYCRKYIRTTVDGSYKATVYPEQSYIIAIIDDTWAAPSHTGVILREDQVRDGLDFQLARGTIIRGTITSEADESPLAGETITLNQIGPELPEGFRSQSDGREGDLVRWAKSDAAGCYVLRVGPGTYEMWGPDYAKRERLVIATEEEIVRSFEFDKPDLKPLAGLVVNETNDEKPVSGAIVYAAPTDQDRRNRRESEAITDSQGRFKVARGVGPMIVYARDVEGLSATSVKVGDDQENVTVPLVPAAKATGRVVDETGKPLAGQQVHCSLSIRVGDASAWMPGFAQPSTDANGIFSVPGLPDGAHCDVLLLNPARSSFEQAYAFDVRGSENIDIPDLIARASEPVPATRPAGVSNAPRRPSATSRPATRPTAESARPPLWLSLVLGSPIAKLQDFRYRVSSARSLKGVGILPPFKLVVHPAESPSRTVHCPLSRLDRVLASVRENNSGGFSARVNGDRLGNAEQKALGELADGEYLAAIYLGDIRCSNIAPFTIDSKDDPAKIAPVELSAIEAGPAAVWPNLALRITGPTPKDPDLNRMAMMVAPLIIDGIEHRAIGGGGNGDFYSALPSGSQML
ncbi:MAG: carboxypeptidase regulatory-like domain-containing protein, partial [Planctomycetes bacterium]|nr:carboxypeptidase regulatory-like domain-containing protein [Planctomycetota bacterium]